MVPLGGHPVDEPFTVEDLHSKPIKSEWKPGDLVDISGVYKVEHAGYHTLPGSKFSIREQIICYQGDTFRTCNRCGGQLRFYLQADGKPVAESEYLT